MRSQPPIKSERDWQILDVCLDLHMSATGAADPLPDDVRDQMAAWLKHRVDNWHKTYNNSERFDDAVFLLCRAALADAERERARHAEYVLCKTESEHLIDMKTGVLKTIVGFAELMETNKTSAQDLAIMFIAAAKDARAALKKDGL